MSDNSLATLQFLGYTAKEFSFHLKEQSIEKGENVSYTPEFDCALNKIDDNNNTLTLSVKLGHNDNLPFSLSVSLEGRFQIEPSPTDEEDYVINAAAILFPYLRASVSQLTSTANVPPLVLPTINIVNLFE